MVLIVHPGHKLSKKEEVTIEEIENEVWIMRENGSGTREFLNRQFEKIGLNPMNMMELGSS